LIIDKIREKYGFTSIVHATSRMEGARAIARSKLVGDSFLNIAANRTQGVPHR